MKNRFFYCFLLSIASGLSTTITNAQTVATCGDTKGFALYHHAGVVQKKDSGFSKDEITSGMTTIQKNGKDNYDILMVDARKKIMSLTQEGGTVMLLRKGKKDATFMHYYPGMVVELYTIWVDGEGKGRYDLIQSKGGDAMPIHKSSVLTGKCDSIDFELLN